MFRDGRAVDDGTELESDVCVIGAGAAGITLGHALAGTGLTVLVLESGGLRADLETQSLYTGLVIGHPYFGLDECRLRFFGGTTNHWNGWCRPYDEIDLAERKWVPNSGWPLSRAELDPYYARAHPLCGLGPYDYTVATWSRVMRARPLPLGDRRLTDIVYQFSPPTRFGQTYREELRRASNVTVLLYTNAVRLEAALGGGRVTRVRAATLTGTRFSVRARRFVLAAGGIENARLLLASANVERAGLGNRRDLVGRYFADHPHAPVALLLLPSRPRLTAFYDRHERLRGATVRGALAVSNAYARSEKLLRFSGTLDLVEDDPYVDRQSSHEKRAERLGRDVGAVARDVQGVSTEGQRLFSFYMRAEQAPNPDSRVTLDDGVDQLGMPRVRLDWRLSELDRRTVVRAVEVLGAAVGARGLGRVYSRPAAEESFWPAVTGGNHHLGTARMHRDPNRGVVDERCRVHGIGNLYVAGSAVFPTTGFANPTLTIVALALRLADDLRRRPS